jgi:hypothetical protein
MGWGAVDDAAFADGVGHIIPMGADEQVRRTDAGTDIAMVANALSVWDFAAGDCPSVAMGTDFTAATFRHNRSLRGDVLSISSMLWGFCGL